jgi:type I restriction enzyme S subunit
MKGETKKTLMPRLRFPAFSDGSGWKSERMEMLYSFMRNNTLSRDKLNYEHGTVKNIHYGDIHTKFQARFDITKERVPFINEREPLPPADSEDYCFEGDLIFADASEDTNDVGKSIELVNLNGERLLSGQHTILARRTDDRITVGFSGYLFRSRCIRAQIEKQAQGTKVYAISAKRLADVDVAFPTNAAEQRKIAACLSSLDDCIAAEGRKLEALRSHKKGLMQQLFPRPGESRPRLRFPEFSNAGEWEEKPLGDIFGTMTGGTPERTVKKYWNGTIPWVTTSLVDFNIIGQAEEFITEAGLANSSAKLFPKNTILMALYGQGKTRGKVALLGIEAATNQACAAILPRQGFNTSFTFLSLSGRYDELRSLSNSGGQENLSQGLVRGLPFRYPADPSEQQRIAACLSSLDDLLAAQSRKVEGLKMHKKGLMQQLFPLGEG